MGQQQQQQVAPSALLGFLVWFGLCVEAHKQKHEIKERTREKERKCTSAPLQCLLCLRAAAPQGTPRRNCLAPVGAGGGGGDGLVSHHSSPRN